MSHVKGAFALRQLIFHPKTPKQGHCLRDILESFKLGALYSIIVFICLYHQCSKDCGHGTQTRPVMCRFNGTIATNEHCSVVHKPIVSRSCYGRKCKTSSEIARDARSNWEVSEWSQVKMLFFLTFRLKQLRLSIEVSRKTQ